MCIEYKRQSFGLKMATPLLLMLWIACRSCHANVYILLIPCRMIVVSQPHFVLLMTNAFIKASMRSDIA